MVVTSLGLGFNFTVGRYWEIIMKYIQIFGLALALALFGPGCASDNSKSPSSQNIVHQAPPLPEGVTLSKDKDIQGVWIAPGFDFKGYDTLYIGDTDFKAIERPNEVKMRDMAIASLQTQEVGAIQMSGLFKTVTAGTNSIPDGERTLKLENTIIEYEKGGGGARYWAGIYGAGQPVIKVRGLMYNGDKLVFVYEARRSGDSGTARMFGGFMGDDTIQRNDIHDLAVDLAGFMKRTAAAK